MAKAKNKASKRQDSTAQPPASKSAKFYTGGMGEHLVMAELLARGFNVARAVVDEGIDVIAFKPDKPQNLFRLQVKTSLPGSGGTLTTKKFTFSLQRAAYEREGGQDYYLLLVLRDPVKQEFVSAVIPKPILDDYIHDGDVFNWSDAKQSYQIGVHLHDNGTLTLKNKSGTDVTNQTKNRWDRIG